MGACWWAYPRAQAAVALHTSATLFADYALCMVGPTGPELLRDNPSEFQRLVRRRLVAAQADERPFERCAPAAQALTQEGRVERAHQAAASSFVEYGATMRARAGQPAGTHRLEALRVTTRPLAQLSKRAWPFSDEGYTGLVKGSVNAREAPHPVAPPRPSLGSGLPAWRAAYRSTWRVGQRWYAAFGAGANLSVHESTDGGLSWTPSDHRAPGLEQHAGHCGAEGRRFELELDPTGEGILLAMIGEDGTRSTAEVGTAAEPVFALACDATVAVIGIQSEPDHRIRLRRCGWGTECRDMALPQLGENGLVPRSPADLARVEGTTILALSMGDVVRVASTRDEGRRWTPFTPAFDRAEHVDFEARVPTVRRLLVLGKRTFLYGGGERTTDSYPVVVSDDQGATWRSPEL